jgi:hypothetical protein
VEQLDQWEEQSLHPSPHPGVLPLRRLIPIGTPGGWRTALEQQIARERQDMLEQQGFMEEEVLREMSRIKPERVDECNAQQLVAGPMNPHLSSARGRIPPPTVFATDLTALGGMSVRPCPRRARRAHPTNPHQAQMTALIGHMRKVFVLHPDAESPRGGRSRRRSGPTR